MSPVPAHDSTATTALPPEPAHGRSWTLRDMQAADLPGLQALLPTLGYPSSPQDLARRWAWLSAVPHQRLLVAVPTDNSHKAGELAGFAHVQGIRRMDSDGYAELLSLVVAPAWQRQGVGRALVQASRQAALGLGHTRLRLGSGAHREEAHRFYEAQGFTRCRPGLVFEQRLSAGGG